MFQATKIKKQSDKLRVLRAFLFASVAHSYINYNLYTTFDGKPKFVEDEATWQLFAGVQAFLAVIAAAFVLVARCSNSDEDEGEDDAVLEGVAPEEEKKQQ
jgi:hypothetical protein